jgi:hypothetical protein
MKACTGRRAIVNTYKLVLKPGTPWVRVDDIPDLIAKALHPLPLGDRGDPNWVHEASEILAARKAAENGHITLLYEAIRKGDLIARNQFTNYADPAAEGDQLRNARVSIDDLKSYLSRFSIEACVFPRLPVRLSKLPPPIDPIDTSRSMDLSHRYTFTEPNWEKWKLIDSTRLWKAACLAANIEPPMDGAEDLWYERQLTHFPAAFKQIWEILNWDEIFSQVPLVNVSGRMLHTIGIADFGQWAINKRLKIPEPLREIVARYVQANGASSAVPPPVKTEPTPSEPQSEAVAKWWHEYKPLEMAQRITKRMREENNLVLTGKDKGKVSAVRICREIADEITSTEKRRATKRGERATPISYKTIETYLKEKGFNPNP